MSSFVINKIESNSLFKGSIGWWPLNAKVACWWLVVKIVVKAFIFEHNCRAEGSFWMIQLAVLWVIVLQLSKLSSGQSSRKISSWGELCFRYILTSVLSLTKNTTCTHIFNSSGKCLREHSPLWWYSSSPSWYNTWGKTKNQTLF